MNFLETSYRCNNMPDDSIVPLTYLHQHENLSVSIDFLRKIKD